MVEDPFDFSTLEAGIENVTKRLSEELEKLRTGGRFNPDTLVNLRVHLVKDSKATERLGDLAQVLPKGGRSLILLVGEKDVSSSCVTMKCEGQELIVFAACKTHHICDPGLERLESSTAA